ncbi:MAG: hypothetical protein WCC94_12360 [Candidatus Bathyarchaeia archaeon]
MVLIVDGSSIMCGQIALVTEIPSFEAGLIAFLFVFLLMGIMYYVLRTERSKTMPQLNPLGPRDMVTLENPMSSSDAPFLAIITLVILELVMDVLIVVSVLQGMGSIAVGTMLAVAAFLAAAILAVYRSAFVKEAFTRKPRLEVVSARQFEKAGEGEKHD